MKLSKIAILALKGMGQDIKVRIAEITGAKPGTVYLWITENKPNGDLTKTAVVQLIEQETGLTADQILEDSEVQAVA